LSSGRHETRYGDSSWRWGTLIERLEMHTRERTRVSRAIFPDTVVDVRGRPAGIRHTTLLTLTALVGCLALIALVATLILCWTVHPMLTIAVAAALIWPGSRLVAKAFVTDGRSR
jgi:hypothetical protein